MFRSLIAKLGSAKSSINKFRLNTASAKFNSINHNIITTNSKPSSSTSSSSVKKNKKPSPKKMNNLIEILVYGAFGASLYYVYQRYKKWNEIKEDFKAQLVEFKGFKQPIFQINGYFFPQIMITKLEKIKEFKTKPSDVWVASFPKSGTTWLQEIVYLIMNDCDFTKAKSKILEERSPFIEYPKPEIEYINKMESPRVIKTHLPFEFLPDDLEKKSKIVYIVRNPKDVCVSLYYFTKMIRDVGYNGNIADMIDLFIEGKIPFGPWPKHVDSYTSKSNIHFIHYEDLLCNPKKEIKRLCVYLEKEFDDKQIDSIIQWCSFDNMKKNPSVNYEWKKKEGFFNKEGEFFRKGKIGDWLNHFTNEQSKQVDQIVNNQLNYKRKFYYGILNNDN